MNKKSPLLVSTLTLLVLITGYIYVYVRYSGSILFDIRLTQVLGFTAVAYLYIVLVAGPLRKLIPDNWLTSLLIENRKYLGLSAWLFALLHGINSFFTQLGGISGLQFLTTKFLFAVALGSISLLILCVMAGTSIEPIVKKLGFKNWKLVHKLIYICSLATLIHTLMLGSHFSDLSKTIPGIFHVGLIVLILLECLRFEKENTWFRVGPITTIGLAVSVSSLFWFPTIRIGIHPSHVQEAPTDHPQTISTNQNHTAGLYMPGMEGDSKLKFAVNIDIPKTIIANEQTVLGFSIFNASNGDQLSYLATPYEKPVHLIIVDDDLEQFYHVHPEQISPGQFSLNFAFPKSGIYRLYLDYQPLRAVEQSQALSVNVIDSTNKIANFAQVNRPSTQKNTFTVELKSSALMNLSDIKKQNSFIDFFVVNDEEMPASNIQPYLNTSGHLVLINKTTRDYYHLHAALQAPPKSGQLFGPDLKFLVMETSTPFKTGEYKAFLQIKSEDQVEIFPFDIIIR